MLRIQLIEFKVRCICNAGTKIVLHQLLAFSSLIYHFIAAAEAKLPLTISVSENHE